MTELASRASEAESKAAEGASGAAGEADEASAAEVEELRSKLSASETTADKLRKAASHWKAQHGEVKTQLDEVSAAKQALEAAAAAGWCASSIIIVSCGRGRSSSGQRGRCFELGGCKGTMLHSWRQQSKPKRVRKRLPSRAPQNWKRQLQKPTKEELSEQLEKFRKAAKHWKVRVRRRKSKGWGRQGRAIE